MELEPRYGRAWLRLGEAAYELEKFAEAGDAFVRAYDLTPDPAPEILYYAGVSLLMGQQAEQSLAALEKLLTGSPPGRGAGLVPGAHFGRHPGRPAGRGCNRSWIVCWPTIPKMPRAWELSYQFAAGQEDYRAAAVSLTIAGYLRPLSHAELVQLGDLYAVISVPIQAARYYEQAMARPDADVETGRVEEFERLASAWLGAHDYDRARATLKTALGQKENLGLVVAAGGSRIHGRGFRGGPDGL